MKSSLRRILSTFVLLEFLSVNIWTAFANPLNMSVVLTDIQQSAVTTHTISYSPPVPMQNNWQLVVHDDNSDLSAVTSGDVSVTGTNVTGSAATVDLMNNDIIITVFVTGTTSNPLTVGINNVGNPGFAGSSRLTITEKNDTGVIQNQDYTYMNTANMGSLQIQSFTSSNFHFREPTTLAFTVLPTTNLQNNEWIRVDLATSFMNFSNTTLSDVVIDSATNGCGVAAIDNQTSYLDIQLCSSSDTAGDPISFHIDNVKLPEVQTFNNIAITTFNELRDTSYDQGFVGNFMAEHPLKATVTPAVFSAGASVVTYNVSILPQGSTVEAFDRINVNFPSGTGLNNSSFVDTSSDYDYNNISVSSGAVAFNINSQTGTGAEPITFSVVGSVPNNIGPKNLNISIDGDEDNNGGTDGTAFIGDSDPYMVMMRVEPYPDSQVPGDTTTHRVLFRPNPSAESNWHVRLTYTDPTTVDLSGVTAGDISLSGNNSPLANNVVIDNTAKTIDFDLFYSTSDSSGAPIVINIDNVVNPAAAGTYTAKVEVFDQLMTPTNNGTGTFTVGSLFPINVVVDIPYENAQSPFHLNMQPPVNVKNGWDILLQFPPSVDLSDVDAADMSISNWDHFSGLNNVVVDNTAKTIRAQLQFPSSDGSDGDDLDLDLLDIITPPTAGTYTIQAFFLTPPDTSGAASLVASQGTGDFTINAGGPPFLVSSYPANHSTLQPRSPQHVYVINDLDSPVNVASLDLKVDNLDVYIDGVCQTADFDCAAIVPSGNQITVSFLPKVPYGGGTTVPVYIYAEDGNAIGMTRNQSFSTVYGMSDPQNPYAETRVNTAQSGQSSPAYISGNDPVFSAMYYDSDNVPATHYQLEVSTDNTFADSTPGVLMYDSGKTAFVATVNNGDRTPDLPEGPSYTTLAPYQYDTVYYWRIRYWEENLNGILPTEWSTTQEFTLVNLPYLVSADPAYGGTTSNQSPPLTYVFKDDGEGMDPNNLTATLHWWDAGFTTLHDEPLITYNGGTGLYECDPTFTSSCSIVDNGDGSITVTVQPTSTFDVGAFVYVDFLVQDLAAIPNQQFFEPYFYVVLPDTTPPSVTAQTPADLATDVSPSPSFSYTIEDTDSDVNISTVNITVNGVPAIVGTISGPVCQAGFTCSPFPVANGPSVTFTFTQDTPFTGSQTVNVHIDANDTAGTPNTMSFDTSFNIQADATPPSVTAQTPANAATGQPLSPSFSYTITDADSLVAAATVNITVEGVPAITGGVCQSGFTCTLTPGVDASSLTFAFTSDTPYSNNQVVNVVVEADDTATGTPNHMTYNTSFTAFEDTTAPNINVISPIGGSVSLTPTFSYEFTDADSLVDVSTVNITVDGVPAIVGTISGPVCQAGFTCSALPVVDAASVTFTFTRDTPFNPSQLVPVSISVYDTAATPNPAVGGGFFTTRANTAPTAPTGLLANGLTNPTTLTPGNVTFSALHHDPEADAANKYRIQIASDSGFGTIIYDSGAAGTAMPSTADGARNTPDIDPPGTMTAGSYFWRIKFWDDLGSEGAFSATANFTILASDTTPPAIISQTPAASATSVALSPSFSYTIADVDSLVDISTVNITVAGEAAIVAGTCGVGYTCSSLPGVDAASVTFTFQRNAAFSNSQNVTVSVTANDTATAPNTLNASSSFTTVASSGGPVPVTGGSGGGFAPTPPATNANSNTATPPATTPPANTNSNTPARPSAPVQPPITAPIADTCTYFENLASSGTVNYGDLATDKILSDYAKYLLDNGIILGKNPTEFGPTDVMTRAEVLRSLVQARCDKFTLLPVTVKPFPDVSVNHPDAIYIDAARRAGIVNGYQEDGTYRPDKFISRAESLKIVIQEVLGTDVKNFDGPLNPFTDVGNTEWYVNYVRFGVASGLVVVPGNKLFHPNEPMNREEITRLLAKALQSREQILDLAKHGATAEQIAKAIADRNAQDLIDNPHEAAPPADKTVAKDDIVTKPIQACTYFANRETTHNYTDISNSDLGDFAQQLLNYGVVIGKEQNTFSPRDEITRSEILRIMIQANCKDYVLTPVTAKPFPDVPANHRDAAFIQAAKAAKIIKGYGDGSFKPDNKISHAEIMKILLETALNKIIANFDSEKPAPFADVDAGAWYARYVRFAAFHDLAVTVDGANFDPNGNGNRGFIAATLLRILKFRDAVQGQR